MVEEQHCPWVKRLFVGFARTSDCNGPRRPDGSHHLIQEIDSQLPVSRPALQLTYNIFGSSPPTQSFDPAKLLTVSLFHLLVSFCYPELQFFIFYELESEADLLFI